MPTPALDFCQKVDTWQRADGASSGLPVLMPAREQDTLASILAAVNSTGPSALLEDRARRWLISYRELVAQQGGLTPAQEAELDAIVRCIPLWDARERKQHRSGWELTWPPGRQLALTLIAVIFVIAAGLSISALIIGANPANPVQPPGNSQPLPAQQQVPAGTTDLDNFKHDWGPFTQLAVDEQHPQTHAPAVLLLESGGYYATGWRLPDSDAAWTADMGGHVTAVDVQGTHAVITDADGNTWVVGTDQPFTFASDPGTIIKIGRTGDVLTMPEDHAIAARLPA